MQIDCGENNCLDRGKITIGNTRLGEQGFYIGRAMPSYGLERSLLANPYKKVKHFEDDNANALLMIKYRKFLWSEIKKESEVCQLLNQMADLIIANKHIKLICWCKSEDRGEKNKCHGDIVRNAVEWIIRERKKNEQKETN